MAYDYTECDEVADSMSLPHPLNFTEALALVDREMPDETYTVRSNVAEALARRSQRILK